jgi:D-alanyl-D-alanine carboxypeptidase
VAWRSEADSRLDQARGATHPALHTPLLSVRRAPTIVAAPFATQHLVADLEELSVAFPADSCLSVRGPGLSFDHRADAPMIPASTQKLLTATAALEVLGADPPVLDTVERALRDSDNQAAEALLSEVGGTAVVTRVLSDLGTPRVVDATGRSHDNRVTCRLLVDLLLRPGTGGLLDERLPVAGESGTLANRFVDTDLVGVLRAKTGSLTSVLGLAGVVDDGDPPLTFALLVNAAPGTPIPAGVDELEAEVAEALARWPAAPAALGPRGPGG